jgi:hypothetical protein
MLSNGAIILRQIHSRLLSLAFESHFFPTITLGDGVSSQNLIPSSSHQRNSMVGANVGSYSRGQKQPMICWGERTQI